MWRVETFDTLPSTQDVARARAEAGEAEGLVVHSYAQGSGRGRRGNEWVSPPGNLYLSLLMRPEVSPPDVGQLAFVLAVAAARAVEPLMRPGHSLSLKWPNDVLVDGRKLAGILLESSLLHGRVDWVVAGMGLNVLAAPAGRIGLEECCSSAPAVDAVRDSFLAQLAQVLGQWRREGFGPIRDAWMARAAFLGQEITARLTGRTLQGVFRGVDADGALLLEIPGEVLAIRSAEVYGPA